MIIVEVLYDCVVGTTRAAVWHDRTGGRTTHHERLR